MNTAAFVVIHLLPCPRKAHPRLAAVLRTLHLAGCPPLAQSQPPFLASERVAVLHQLAVRRYHQGLHPEVNPHGVIRGLRLPEEFAVNEDAGVVRTRRVPHQSHRTHLAGVFGYEVVVLVGAPVDEFTESLGYEQLTVFMERLLRQSLPAYGHRLAVGLGLVLGQTHFRSFALTAEGLEEVGIPVGEVVHHAFEDFCVVLAEIRQFRVFQEYPVHVVHQIRAARQALARLLVEALALVQREIVDLAAAPEEPREVIDLRGVRIEFYAEGTEHIKSNVFILQ